MTTNPIPMSVVEAAPGMREALKKVLAELGDGACSHATFEEGHAALAACDGKGE